jgi:alpha-1,2-mannosyltransferase
MYFFGGQFVNLAIVNSKWTRGHVQQRWGGQAALVHPPVDVDKFLPSEVQPPADAAQSVEADETKLQRRARDIAIISCAQFRPEKDHSLQIEILRLVHEKMQAEGKDTLSLSVLRVV